MNIEMITLAACASTIPFACAGAGLWWLKRAGWQEVDWPAGLMVIVGGGAGAAVWWCLWPL